MKSRLKTLVSLIQTITEQTVEQVAKSVNYSRNWLTTEMGKEEPSPAVVRVLTEKYRNEIADFFDQSSFILEEPGEEYGKDIKIVDAEQLLVHDSLVIKGMLRVILRTQAEILAGQKKVSLKKALAELTKAVRDETQAEFDEL